MCGSCTEKAGKDDLVCFSVAALCVTRDTTESPGKTDAKVRIVQGMGVLSTRPGTAFTMQSYSKSSNITFIY